MSGRRVILAILLMATIIACVQCFTPLKVNKASDILLPPQLPNSFNATVTAVLPFFGQVRGPYYFDYPNSRTRQDMTMFGTTQATVQLYNDKVQYDIMLPSGPCKMTPLTTELFPMIIPPIALFVGNEQVNGKNCQHWALPLPQITLNFWVSNDTNSQTSKNDYYMVRFSTKSDQAMMDIQMDFDNVVAGPQSDSLFNIWKQTGCPTPVPPVTYYVRGYTKNAVNNQLVPNVKLALTIAGQTFSAVSDKNGYYSIENVPEGNATIKSDASGYVPITHHVQVTQNINQGTVADLYLSPVIPQGTWRAVLTWKATPRDLDAHMFLPNGCQVDYRNKVCSQSNVGKSTLDYDVRNGYGPETITFTPEGNGVSGDFTFFVYNFSAEAPFFNSGANVKVYNDKGFVQEIVIPTSGYSASDRFWKVFSVNQNSVIVYNQVVSSM